MVTSYRDKVGKQENNTSRRVNHTPVCNFSHLAFSSFFGEMNKVELWPPAETPCVVTRAAWAGQPESCSLATAACTAPLDLISVKSREWNVMYTN